MNELQPEILEALVKTKMPFGKYKGVLMCDLPVYYLEWFARKGLPAGKLGMMMSTMLVIKSNGLDYLLQPPEKDIVKDSWIGLSLMNINVTFLIIICIFT